MTVSAISVDHHAGPRIIARDPNRDDRDVVYDYIRDTHTFLTDENHLVRFDDRLNIQIHRRAGCTDYSDSWETYWFSQCWQIVTPQTYEDYIEELIRRRVDYLQSSLKCRDTVRGRRERNRLLSLADGMERQVRVTTDYRADLLAGNYWRPSIPEIQSSMPHGNS